MDPSTSVAVIEAGGFYEQDNGNYSVLPGLLPSIPFLATTEVFPQNPLMDWGLVSVPQTGAMNRRIHYAQGKTLSGSSGINGMTYLRGTTGAYDRWADLVGDQSYTFKSLLPYFEKSCKFSPPNNAKRQTPNATVRYDPSVFSSTGGPLRVSYSNWVDVAMTWFQRAFTSIGLPISDTGFNSGSLTGNAAWIPSTIDPTLGERSSSQTSFLEEAIQNTNIIVYTQAQASKILFKDKTVNGVSVTTQGVDYTISANREVILSAGAFHSPQLLMISGRHFSRIGDQSRELNIPSLGIGPRATLEQYKIPVLSDLPGVGQNLWDRPAFSVGAEVNLPVQAQLISQPAALSELLDSASGPLSSLNALVAHEKIPQSLRANFTGAATTALAHFPSDWPDVEYVTETGLSPTGRALGVIQAVLAAPVSRGNVTIAGADISTPPVFNMAWLSDTANADAQVAVAAFKRIRQAWRSIANTTLGPEIVPGPTVQSDADILAYIRNVSVPFYHAGATCAMGRKSDANAVVDSQARVFGVQGLRVVDMSAAPFMPPGHPMATVYMLAEKIAADIQTRGTESA